MKDRKELNDRTFLRRIVQHWAETAKDQTYKADSKRRIDHNRLIRVKSAWLDNLRCACSIMKQIQVAEQMMKSLRNKWMTVQMFDLWDETSYSEHEAKMAKLVNSPTVEQEGPRQPMTATECIEARQALQIRSNERYNKIVLKYCFGSWVVCLAIRAKLTRIKEQRSKSAARKRFRLWVYFVHKKKRIKDVQRQTQQTRCARALREWKSALLLIKLKKRKETQYQLDILQSMYKSWQNGTRRIITHRQELLTKYDVNATVDSRSIDFLEGVDKILSNVIRILDKRRIQSKYSRMFTNWQDFTMIGQYIAQYDMRSIAKIFRLWRQFVSGKHFEDYRAQRSATHVIKLWSKYAMKQFRVRIQTVWKPIMKTFTKWRQRYLLKLKELEIRYRPVRMWVDKHTMLEQFFSLWVEYYDTKYIVSRDRLEYHFKIRNFIRSVKPIFTEWAYYTSMEDMDSNRKWVIHGYERLKRTRWRLLQYCNSRKPNLSSHENQIFQVERGCKHSNDAANIGNTSNVISSLIAV